MKRFWCSCPYDDTEIKEAIDGYWVSFDEADAELKRRDDDIAELKLRIFVAGKFIKEKYTKPVDLKEDLEWLFSIDSEKLNRFLKLNPEYVPSGNGEQK